MTAAPTPIFDFNVGFKPFADRIKGERAKRLEQAPRRISLGVSWLDRALGGLFPNDVILIGAHTGAGKTELSTLIAMKNAAAGKRVHYFALEAEEAEIERRIKYKLLVGLASSSVQYGAIRPTLNYLDWYSGNLEKVFGPLEDAAEERLAKQYATLSTFYRVRDFKGDALERDILAIQAVTDLIIIDHLHYIDTDDTNENRGYKEIVKRIRDVALSVGKPIVVVAHLRKQDRARPRIVPTLDDFHGTSDIVKIATKAVIVAPAYDLPPVAGEPWMFPTYIHPAKCRPDGQRTKLVGVVNFDVRSNSYADTYRVGKVSNDGTKWDEKTIDLPQWATAPVTRREQPESRSPGEDDE